MVFIGQLKQPVPPEQQAEITTLLWSHACVPVFFPASFTRDERDGYATSVLWPLLHNSIPDRHNGGRGGDGTVVSALKFEFATCNVLCSSISSSSQLAEPRTSDQLQYLARLMRESGDDSMWVGLTPVTPTAYGPGTDGWKWHGSHTALLAAQESWAPGQPGTDGQCVSLWTDGTWNVRGCGGDSRANKVCACEHVLD